MKICFGFLSLKAAKKINKRKQDRLLGSMWTGFILNWGHTLITKKKLLKEKTLILLTAFREYTEIAKG